MAKFSRTTRIRLLGGELIYIQQGDDGASMTRALQGVKRRAFDLSVPFQQFQPVWMAQERAVFAAEGLPMPWPALSPAYCVAVGTPVLTKDLRWVPVERLVPGDVLWAPSEDSVADRVGHPWRYWEESVVEIAEPDNAPAARISFESGNTVVSTYEHPWLVRGHGSSWRPTELSCGSCQRVFDSPAGLGLHRRKAHGIPGAGWHGRAKIDTTIAWRATSEIRPGDVLPRYLDVWGEDRSYEAGWLAAMMDGEGHLSVKRGRGAVTERSAVVTLGISQKEGRVSERLREVMGDLGVDWAESTGRAVVQFRLNGGSASVASLIGRVRPVRLVPKWRGGVMRAIDEERVGQVEDVGVVPIIRLQTSSRTFFAAGLAAHNSYWKQSNWPGKTIMRRTDRLYASLTAMTGDTIWQVSPRTIKFGTNVPYEAYNRNRPVLVLLDETFTRLNQMVMAFITEPLNNA